MKHDRSFGRSIYRDLDYKLHHDLSTCLVPIDSHEFRTANKNFYDPFNHMLYVRGNKSAISSPQNNQFWNKDEDNHLSHYHGYSDNLSSWVIIYIMLPTNNHGQINNALVSGYMVLKNRVLAYLKLLAAGDYVFITKVEIFFYWSFFVINIFVRSFYT